MIVSMATMYESVDENHKTTWRATVLHTLDAHQCLIVLEITCQNSHVFWIRHYSGHNLRDSELERNVS
jgi:hypothetical protein